MSLNPIPMPIDTPLVNKSGLMTWPWVQNMTERNDQIQAAPERVVDKALGNALSASIAASALTIGTSGGFYRLNIYARITRAATTSSSLQITIAWTEGGQALTKVYAALTANTVTTLQSDLLAITVDANTSLTYAAAYASVGATPMLFGLRVVVERLA